MTNDRRRERGPRPMASVDIIDNPRVPVSTKRRPTQETFIAQNEDRRESTREGDVGGVITEHNRPGTVIMYKPTETQGFVPRRVSVSSLRLLLRQGWHEFCPDCKSEHLDRNGEASTDPNLCSARPPVAVRECPVCRKRIYDNQGIPKREVTTADPYDPNLIPDEAPASTPESRTRIQLDLHLWSKHPRQAQMMGRPPLPQALREIADSVQASIG
mgnify:CR=1 FL=1